MMLLKSGKYFDRLLEVDGPGASVMILDDDPSWWLRFWDEIDTKTTFFCFSQLQVGLESR